MMTTKTRHWFQLASHQYNYWRNEEGKSSPSIKVLLTKR